MLLPAETTVKLLTATATWVARRVSEGKRLPGWPGHPIHKRKSVIFLPSLASGRIVAFRSEKGRSRGAKDDDHRAPSAASLASGLRGRFPAGGAQAFQEVGDFLVDRGGLEDD